MLFQILILIILVFVIFPFAIGNQVKYNKEKFDKINKKNKPKK